jgi:hypothetical protein
MELTPHRFIQLKKREDIIGLARDRTLGENANLYAVLQKDAAESEFKLPIQGVYAGTVSEEMARAWHELR